MSQSRCRPARTVGEADAAHYRVNTSGRNRVVVEALTCGCAEEHNHRATVRRAAAGRIIAWIVTRVDDEAMTEQTFFRGLADAVLAAHVLLVCFVVGGLAVIWIGHALRWHRVDAWPFRCAHLATIAVVVAESWFDITCPLTTWERMLRLRAQDASYEGSFIGHWLQRLLYHDAPPWVFIVAYTAFGVAVVATWVWLPPRRRVRRSSG